ncbi:peptidase M14 [Aquibacillus halophilus]|uniref:Peptidase M14 n=1 Tax=Aquibacillus halophilus TaxID=930132 RepID=A0A6A8DLP1_9BACI|nr:M14 family metallocarboxypeptidase [Aquibacillus halophilus]MRH44679.1 peptidase M14 [Aquibacillus halophilus]
MESIVNPKVIYTYQQMVKDLKKLNQVYPNLVTYDVIGKSVDNRNIYAVKLGFGETEIFLNGAHHAREWLTTSLLMNMIDYYSQAYEANNSIGGYDVKTLLNKATIWFVPMVNPDGVSLVQLGVNSAKRPDEVIAINNGNDFSTWKANIRGVDLNRQYPADWDSIQDNVGHPASMMYKGPTPLSEPESKTVYTFTLNHDFKLAVAYHSSGEEIFWKYKCKGELLETSKRIAEIFSEKTEYQLVDPGPNPSGGGYTDWFLTTLKRPAFTPEISPLVGPRPVPLKNYDKIWKDNKEVGLMLATEAYLHL